MVPRQRITFQILIKDHWKEMEHYRSQEVQHWCHCGHDQDTGPGGGSPRRFLHRRRTVPSCCLPQETSPTLQGNYTTHQSDRSVLWKAADGAHLRARQYTPHQRTPHTRTRAPGPASSLQWCPCGECLDRWRQAPSKSSQSHQSPSNGDQSLILASWWHWGWCQSAQGGQEVAARCLCRWRCHLGGRWSVLGEPSWGPDTPRWNLDTHI